MRKRIINLVLGTLLQAFAMAVDIFLIISLIALLHYEDTFGFIAVALVVVLYNMNNGGWFYAWRPSVIKKFWKNWMNL